MSASSMRDGLYQTLISASTFSATEVTKDDYGVLARTSNCSLVINPPSTTRVDMHGYGRSWQVFYVFPVEGYVRDYGDPTRIPHQVTQLVGDMLNAVHADQSLNSTACAAAVTTINIPRAATGGPILLDIGGQSWIPVFMNVEGLEVKE